MIVLLLAGVALWWAAHLYKRMAPAGRAALTDRLGEGSKGVFALALVLSVVLMVVGYRGAGFTPIYDPPSWGKHLNNLLMVVSVILFGLGSSKSRAKAALRHPMLLGFAVWAAAHLLIRGDLAALILFGGLLAWVPVQILVINRAVPDWTPPEGGSRAGDMRLAAISAVVYAVIVFIHGWLGPWPVGG